MFIDLLWGVWIILGCWAVSRAIIWLPDHMAAEETRFVAEILAIQQLPQPEMPVESSRFSILGWVVASALVAAWAIELYGTSFSVVFWTLFGWGLLVLAGVDARTKLLPDALTLPFVWLGLVIQLFPETRTVGLELSVIGAVAGYLPLWLLAHMYKLIRGRDGLGMGDLKLLAAMGAWSGPFILPQVLLIAALLAIALFVMDRVFRRSGAGIHEERPFGPAIVAAYFIVMTFAYSVGY